MTTIEHWQPPTDSLRYRIVSRMLVPPVETVVPSTSPARHLVTPAMFESLQESLFSAVKTLRGRGKLTESNMRDGLRLVEQALLDADVSLPAIEQFMHGVSEQAVGERVLKSLDPTQQLIGIVHQELVKLMGPVDASLHLRQGATVIMLCGLQGSGKTTTCGKLGRLVEKANKKALLVAADLQRPAAIEQLQVIGQQLGIPVYTEVGATDPVAVCQNAVKQAQSAWLTW